MAKKSKVENEMAVQEEKWRAESDLRTLTEAREIQRDPKRMAAARKLARERMDTLKALSEK